MNIPAVYSCLIQLEELLTIIGLYSPFFQTCILIVPEQIIRALFLFSKLNEI